MSKVTDVFRQAKPGAAPRAPARSSSKEEADDGLGPDERMLRAFDLDSTWGPCAGLTRMERWQRADKFGLAPPLAVKEALMRLPAEANNNLWHGRV